MCKEVIKTILVRNILEVKLITTECSMKTVCPSQLCGFKMPTMGFHGRFAKCDVIVGLSVERLQIHIHAYHIDLYLQISA